jgi:hypothetical protein
MSRQVATVVGERLGTTVVGANVGGRVVVAGSVITTVPGEQSTQTGIVVLEDVELVESSAVVVGARVVDVDEAARVVDVVLVEVVEVVVGHELGLPICLEADACTPFDQVALAAKEGAASDRLWVVVNRNGISSACEGCPFTDHVNGRLASATTVQVAE